MLPSILGRLLKDIVKRRILEFYHENSRTEPPFRRWIVGEERYVPDEASDDQMSAERINAFWRLLPHTVDVEDLRDVDEAFGYFDPYHGLETESEIDFDSDSESESELMPSLMNKYVTPR